MQIGESLLAVSLVGSTIRLATPLILAAMGGIYAERSGVINIALEGIMLAGAFTAAAVTVNTSPWVGLLAAAIAGLLVGLVQGVACIRYRADQVVVSTAINILFAGLPPLLSRAFFASSGATPQLPIEKRLPMTLIYGAFLAVLITLGALYYTRWGLRLRSVGENPEAADMAGINVFQTRYIALMVCGVLAALGGAYLSIGQVSLFTRNMTAGRGFIALAAVILGNWHPVRTLLACLFFGLAEAVVIRMQGVTDIPNQFVQLIPYVLTMIVLAGFIGRVQPPQASGRPYVKERR
jgi:general nucleoside transport system permease protein